MEEEILDFLSEDADLDNLLSQIDTNCADNSSNEYGTFMIPPLNLDRTFNEVSYEDVETFLQENANPQTRRKTLGDVTIFQKFLLSRGEKRNVQYIPPDTLNEHICSFLIAVKKKNGQDYEPGTLRGMISSLDRHLKDVGSKMCIVKDTDFGKARDVLKMKQKQLKGKGLGNKPKAAEPLNDDILQKMYDSNTLGHQNPRALLHSMWLICTTYFGMRTGQEVYNLRWGDVTLCLDESCGREYIQLDTERQTKTRTGSNPKDTR